MTIGEGFNIRRPNIGEADRDRGFATSQGGSESGKLFGIKFSGVEKNPPELPLWRDKAMMGRFPNLYGTAGAITRTIIDAIPYAKYGLSKNREKFMALPKEQQHAALMYDMLEAELYFVAIPAAFKGVGMASKHFMKRISNKGTKVMQPVEDTIGAIQGARGGVWESFSYTRAAEKVLTDKKLAQDEASVIVGALKSKNNTRLTQFHREKALRATEGVTPAFEKNMKSTFLEGTYLSDDLVKELDFNTLQAKHWQELYKTNMKAAGFSSEYSKQVFKGQAQQFFDKEAMKKVSWGEITEEQSGNMIKQMFHDPIPIRKMLSLGSGRVSIPKIQPQRSLFGAGEDLFKTKTLIYDEVKSATAVANGYKLDLQNFAARMLEERGFGKFVSKATGNRFKKNNKTLTKEVEEYTNGMLTKVDNLTNRALLEKDTTKVLELRKELSGMLKGVHEKGGPESQLFSFYRTFHDNLYADAMRRKIPQLFNRAGVSAEGVKWVDDIMKGLEPKLQHHFNSAPGRPYDQQLAFVENTFKGLRSLLKVKTKDGGHLWFGKKGKDLEAAIKGLSVELTPGVKGGFPGLFENYAARIGASGARMDAAASKSLRGEMHGAWTHLRQSPVAKHSDVDFFTRLEGRISAQARDLYLYPALEKVAANAKKLPQVWQNQTDYLIGRVLNRPSNLDHWVANALENTLGKAQQAFTGSRTEGIWDVGRVQRLAQSINNFTYMGFLGFKPMATTRNLFQPYVTGPTDLGRVTDIGTVMRGAARAMNPKTRAEIKRMGAITDFVPEMSHSPMFPKRGAMGKINEVKDLSMWTFRMADRWNRYTMGGAAMIKWEGAIAKHGAPTSKNIGGFFSKTGISNRNPWIVSDIEDKILKGNVAEARELFIKDIIADTQYLYGAIESPTGVGMGGSTGRTAMVFQSWWMNYGAAMEKWMRTAQGPGGKTERLITFMMSSAIAEQSMEAMWGRTTALRQVGFGPLPMEGLGMPPAFAMIFDTLKAVKAGAAIPFGGDPAEAEKDFINVVKKSGNFLPGGNQIMSSLRAYQEEGTKGLAESTMMFHKKKEPSAVEKFLGRKKL